MENWSETNLSNKKILFPFYSVHRRKGFQNNDNSNLASITRQSRLSVTKWEKITINYTISWNLELASLTQRYPFTDGFICLSRDYTYNTRRMEIGVRSVYLRWKLSLGEENLCSGPNGESVLKTIKHHSKYFH